MHFWNGAEHPLGGAFTLSPEDYSTWKTTAHGRNNYYLGYSLERTCMKAPYIPHASRPRQAYVFAKHLKFFIERDYFLFDTHSFKSGEEQVMESDFYTRLQADANVTFVSRMRHDVPGLDIPKGIEEVPHMPNRTAFVQVLGGSRVLLGVGNPPMSPTPWEALCLGVPFINPIKNWLRERPNDRTQWLAQHDGVFFLGLGEPYVYHVKVGDRIGFEEAIRKAMDTPIDRFIPAQMKMSSLIDRTRHLVETDWRPMAKQQLQRNLGEANVLSQDEDDEDP
ncbi:hypothetical protein FRB96_005835 [Tulasnella sp. 330]|nr:hypothetical protein FRB96_005835 [Tulasnella sp. 330]